MSFGRRSGFFQPQSRFGAGSATAAQIVTITRSIVNSSTVSFTFTNAGLPNTNVGYNIIGADVDDFTDSTVLGQVTLNGSGTATLLKTITTAEDVGTTKNFYVSAFAVNDRITGTSGNVTIETSNPFAATGGNSFTVSGNVFHVFTANSTLQVTQLATGAEANSQLRMLLVGAGGSIISTIAGGGGGAGGLIDSNINANAFTTSSYSVVVGNGVASSNGANSTFAGYTAIGGGAGSNGGAAGSAGGSGGGGGSNGSAGGAGTSGQGFAGSAGLSSRNSGGNGGGATEAGLDPSNIITRGGNGKLVSWVPDGYGDPNFPKYFAGGGGGSFNTYAMGSRGDNTGGGGHRSSGETLGRSGIAILSYPTFTPFRSIKLG